MIHIPNELFLQLSARSFPMRFDHGSTFPSPSPSVARSHVQRRRDFSSSREGERAEEAAEAEEVAASAAACAIRGGGVASACSSMQNDSTPHLLSSRFACSSVQHTSRRSKSVQHVIFNEHLRRWLASSALRLPRWPRLQRSSARAEVETKASKCKAALAANAAARYARAVGAPWCSRRLGAGGSPGGLRRIAPQGPRKCSTWAARR